MVLIESFLTSVLCDYFKFICVYQVCKCCYLKLMIPFTWVFFLLFCYTIKCQCCTHIATSQLIYRANQLTGFYMRATLALYGLNVFHFNDDFIHWECVKYSHIFHCAKKKFSMKDFCSKCDQIHRKLHIW